MHADFLLVGDDVIGVVYMVVHGADHVHVIVIERFQQRTGVQGGDAQTDLGIGCSELTIVPHNQRLAQGIRHAQPQGSGRLPLPLRAQQHFLTCMADLLGVAQRVPARVGQADAVPDAVKELDAHFLFQLLDLKGDGGLGIAQLFTGLGEAAQLGDFYKNTQRPQIHSWPPEI